MSPLTKGTCAVHARACTHFAPSGLRRALPGFPRRKYRRHTSHTPSWVACAWGDPVDFHAASIASSSECAKGLTEVEVDAPTDIVDGFCASGQYVQMKVNPEDEKVAYLAIASAPASSPLKFVIKPGDNTAGEICALNAGDSVQISAAMGKGFQPEETAKAAKDLIFVCTGTGAAPVASLIDSSLPSKPYGVSGKVTVYFGAASPEAMPFVDRFESWKANGIDVVCAFSQADSGTAPAGASRALWSSRVQAALGEDEENVDMSPGATAVVLCGQREMSDDVKAQWSAWGGADDVFLSNF